MNTLLNAAIRSIRAFAHEEEGAQVVEYALIIAVVSIALVLGLSALTGVSFTKVIDRINTCLTTASCL